MKYDKNTSLEEIKYKAREFILERKWEKFHKPKDIAISIIMESAELLEMFQWKTDNEIKKLLDKDTSYRDMIAEELADIMINSLSMASTLDIDITKAVIKKIEINSLKYPVDKFYGKAKEFK